MSRRRKLEAMLKDEPDDVFLHYSLAMACATDGDAAEALTHFQAVIDRDPNYVPAYFQKGRVLYEQGETDPAREVITRGIEVARRVGDRHAEGEMTAFLELLE